MQVKFEQNLNTEFIFLDSVKISIVNYFRKITPSDSCKPPTSSMVLY